LTSATNRILDGVKLNVGVAFTTSVGFFGWPVAFSAWRASTVKLTTTAHTTVTRIAAGGRGGKVTAMFPR
jgi:hypothetical protein